MWSGKSDCRVSKNALPCQQKGDFADVVVTLSLLHNQKSQYRGQNKIVNIARGYSKKYIYRGVK
jgi:hypothetical protein